MLAAVAKTVADAKRQIEASDREINRLMKIKEIQLGTLGEAMKQQAKCEERRAHAQTIMEELRPRLTYTLPQDLSLSVFGEVGAKGRCRAALACRRFMQVVATGRKTGLYRVKVVAVAAGAEHTALCSAKGELFTFGCGKNGKLGHGGSGNANSSPDPYRDHDRDPDLTQAQTQCRRMLTLTPTRPPYQHQQHSQPQQLTKLFSIYSALD